MSKRKTSVSYKKHVRDGNGNLRVITVEPKGESVETAVVSADVPIEAEALDTYAIEAAKNEYDVISIDSNQPLTVQRKLAAKKYKMETADLVEVLAGIAHNPNEITSDRIKAIGQASKMLGLDAPTQIETNFKGIMIELSSVTTEDIKRILNK